MFGIGRLAVLASVMFVGLVGLASAGTLNVFVSNELDEPVRLYVDGQLVCDMASGGSCMAPVPDGAHIFRGELLDGSYVEAPVNNPGSSLHWSIDPYGFSEAGK